MYVEFNHEAEANRDTIQETYTSVDFQGQLSNN